MYTRPVGCVDRCRLDGSYRGGDRVVQVVTRRDERARGGERVEGRRKWCAVEVEAEEGDLTAPALGRRATCAVSV